MFGVRNFEHGCVVCTGLEVQRKTNMSAILALADASRIWELAWLMSMCVHVMVFGVRAL